MSTTESPILLTGASGFLGAWILQRAVESGIRIVACDLADDRRRFAQIMPQGLDSPLITWQRLDVTDSATAMQAVGHHRPRAIIHLAALQIPHCARNPALGALVNVVGHVNLFQAARDHGRVPVIYGSSVAAKPRGTAAAPTNLYGVYKKTDEEIARIFWQDHSVPSLGLRPYIVYGVGRDQGETSALTAAMRAAALDEPYHIPFTGRFCFQYAADVADAFLGSALRPVSGALLSDISDQLESVETLAAAIREEIPEARITVDERKRAGPEDGFDTGPAEALLSGLPNTPLREGVRRTIEAFRHTGAV